MYNKLLCAEVFMRLAGPVSVFFILCRVAVTSFSVTTYYVDASRLDDTGDALTWTSATKTIQAAVDLATDGDTIIVTNGNYSLGGVDLHGWNRVCITNSVTLRSVNGPDVTVIQARTGALVGVRCVYASGHPQIVGFTLTNGYFSSYMTHGGGIYVDGEAGAIISNCVITGNSAMDGAGAYQGAYYQCVFTANSAGDRGGGAWGCELYECVLTENSAGSWGGGAMGGVQVDCAFVSNSCGRGGGGVAFTTLSNCTLIGNTGRSGGAILDSVVNNCAVIANSASEGGAAYKMWYRCALNNCTVIGNRATDYDGGGILGSCELNNCIVYYNTAREREQNYSSGATLNHCCTTPMPFLGFGNITNDPALPDTSGHIGANSPCIGAGSSAYASGRDIDGDAWANPPAIGCDEYVESSQTGALSMAISTAYNRFAAGYRIMLHAVVSGRAVSNIWDFGDGTRETNSIEVSHAWMEDGPYTVFLTGYNADYPAGVTATQNIEVIPASEATFYVWTNSPGPVEPYSSWMTAAHTVQAAVDLVMAGGIVVVTDGVYDAGFTVTPGYAANNRICITNPMTVYSVNGPDFTRIAGSGVPSNGDVAIRGVYLAGGATLAGFTISDGCTTGSTPYDACGAGVFVDSVSGGTLTNCVLQRNSSAGDGGAVYRGTLLGCTLNGNVGDSGGGSCGSTLYDCLLSSNTAVGYSGGGATRSTLSRCELKHNYAFNGGGLSYGTAHNSLIHRNAVFLNGGGAYDSTLRGCTVADNDSSLGNAGVFGCALKNTIEYGNPTGNGGNVPNPMFIDPQNADYRLLAASPCIDLGSNVDVVGITDLAGGPRILRSVVDMGAYETDYVVLTVTNGMGVSNPSNGVHRYLAEEGAAFSAFASPDNGLTQYVNNGWSLFGQDPVAGGSNSFNAVMTNDALLTWLWKTNVRFEATAALPGTVVGSESGWYPLNSAIVVAAIPGNYADFTNWAGDVPDGSTTANPLLMVLDCARMIHAQFAVYTAALGTPWWWLAEHGWTNNFDSAEAGDQDTDLLFTWQEYIVGSDPTNSGSAFDVVIRPSTGAVGQVVVEWNPSVSGRLYGVISSSDMTNFSDVAEAPWPAQIWTSTIENTFRAYGVHVELLP